MTPVQAHRVDLDQPATAYLGDARITAMRRGDLPGTIAAEIVRSYMAGRVAPPLATDSTAPFATHPFRTTSDLTGVWSGTISTYEGDLPVYFTVDDTSAV